MCCDCEEIMRRTEVLDSIEGLTAANQLKILEKELDLANLKCASVDEIAYASLVFSVPALAISSAALAYAAKALPEGLNLPYFEVIAILLVISACFGFWLKSQGKKAQDKADRHRSWLIQKITSILREQQSTGILRKTHSRK